MPDDTLALPVLRGPRVTLRPAAAGELDMLADAIAADPEASPWWTPHAPLMREWLADTSMHYLVIEVEGQVIGVIDFAEEPDPHYESAGMDIALLTGLGGKGLGTEALKVLAAWLIDERGHHRLTIDPALANARAIHVYEKIGFRKLGVARSYEKGPDGSWHDNQLMDMLAGELVRV